MDFLIYYLIFHAICFAPFWLSGMFQFDLIKMYSQPATQNIDNIAYKPVITKHLTKSGVTFQHYPKKIIVFNKNRLSITSSIYRHIIHFNEKNSVYKIETIINIYNLFVMVQHFSLFSTLPCLALFLNIFGFLFPFEITPLLIISINIILTVICTYKLKICLFTESVKEQNIGFINEHISPCI